MKIREFKYFPYRLKFNSIFITSKQTFKLRDIIILQLIDDEGNKSYGEAAPLQNFGSENLNDIKNLLKEKISEFSGLEIEDAISLSASPAFNKYPVTKFALEQAIMNFAIHSNYRPVINLISTGVQNKIPVNAVVGKLPLKETVKKIEEITVGNYSSVKIKIGRRNFYDDLQIIDAAYKSIDTKIKLRLDLNGSWLLEKAKENISQITNYNIEFIEQPVKDTNELINLSRTSPIKIAPDESANNLNNTINLIDSDIFDFIVIKPMLNGGIFDTIKMINYANLKGVNIIISSALESAVGRSILPLLASNTNHNFAHGLATTEFYKNDLTPDFYKIKNGFVKFDFDKYKEYITKLSGDEQFEKKLYMA
ncbi:o-succinylbenzoate synthase [bacterium BMS3Abin04]|nr:o-succinylbenzoate synthase [bacterium BMS3Abin04]